MFLNLSQIHDARTAPNAKELLIGVLQDHFIKRVALYWADASVSYINYSKLTPINGRGLAPDFYHASVIDCGQTLLLGEYEAASSWLKDNSTKL